MMHGRKNIKSSCQCLSNSSHLHPPQEFSADLLLPKNKEQCGLLRNSKTFGGLFSNFVCYIGMLFIIFQQLQHAKLCYVPCDFKSCLFRVEKESANTHSKLIIQFSAENIFFKLVIIQFHYLTFWSRNFTFKILTHPVGEMRLIQESNKVAL